MDLKPFKLDIDELLHEFAEITVCTFHWVFSSFRGVVRILALYVLQITKVLGDQEFTTADPAIEEIIKPRCKHTIELSITKVGTLVWEVRVVGWDVSYGAEFVPSIVGGYTFIVQKATKIGPSDEQIISFSFKNGETGKIVLTFDNLTSKKKKLIYTSNTKTSD
ncbi:hypothetical protein CASFOL_004381 [Castilleja foliolosa]|uniref:GOLD domain-containing protein n=1 Tax=Castilleja foliolosa TaxID=1961234 RepID=A0ABD3EED6_9LAMI